MNREQFFQELRTALHREGLGTAGISYFENGRLEFLFPKFSHRALPPLDIFP